MCFFHFITGETALPFSLLSPGFGFYNCVLIILRPEARLGCMLTVLQIFHSVLAAPVAKLMTLCLKISTIKLTGALKLSFLLSFFFLS